MIRQGDGREASLAAPKTGFHLEDYIRAVPDFPQKGVLFRDITPLLSHPAAFNNAIHSMTDLLKDVKPDVVVAVEARGYILGAPVALELGAGFVPVRKPGKLPWRTYKTEYSLEYGSAALELHQDGVKKGERVLIIDDVLATGGTLAATARLVESTGAKVAAMSVLIELTALKGRQNLPGYDVRSLMVY